MLIFCMAAALCAPNVVLLSVDTLRADHLGCYGYANPTSPNLDRLAQRGLLFEDCFCEVPLTAPSLGAMLTSRIPRSTGATRNGLPMPETIPAITQAFQSAGFQTFCVQSNWTLKKKLCGLDRGFDVYDDNFHKKRWWGLVNPERRASEVTDAALTQLSKLDPARPFFAWIHYSDPHAPYRFHRNHAPSGHVHFWNDNRRKVSVKYDSEIAFTDAEIGRLLEALNLDTTVILFVADHGESLYEHDYLGHGRRIYHDGIHIPLFIAGPGIAPGRTTLPARGVDVGPTLLARAGLTPGADMTGLDLLGGTIPQDRPRFIETYGGAVPHLPGAKALMSERPPQRRGVVYQGWKLILDEHDRPELFYLPDDPGELNNRAPQEPQKVADLTAIIATWNAENPRSGTEGANLDADDLNALRSLGYLD